MKKTIHIFSLFILMCSIGHAQSEKINIKSEHLIESNYLKIDDFYLTHHLYIDLFLRENLFPEASPEDVSSIIKAIKKYVSAETPLEIEIEKPDGQSYLIKMATLKNKDGNELLIAFTNWSSKKKIFEKDIKIENDSYTRWYFLNGDKMTYRNDMSTENDYSVMTKSDLANAYIFDELADNDGKIQSTIDAILKEKDLSTSDNIMAHLLLLKYHLFMKDNDQAAKEIEDLNALFEIHKIEPNIKGLEMAFDATKFQMELMK